MPTSNLHPIPRILFMSRWLQLPLYLGLIVAQGVYVWYFLVELMHLVEAAFGSQDALAMILKNVTPVGADTIKAAPETVVMLVVLGLIDVVMISNLLIMVIIGGYETFVSRMRLEGHPDQPEWLSHVNASVLKVKLATAIIGISSIHLLKTFINAQSYEAKVLIAQTVIHITFLVSALAIAAVDRMMPQSRPHAAKHAAADGDARTTDSGSTAWPRSARTTSSRASPTRCSTSPTTTRSTTSRRSGEAYRAEESPAAKDAIAQILTNSRMCAEGHRPICQDTGIVVAFVKVGMDVRWDGARCRSPTWSTRACAAPTSIPTTSCARRSSPIRRARGRTRRTTRRRSSTSSSSPATPSRSRSRPRAAAPRTSRSSRC